MHFPARASQPASQLRKLDDSAYEQGHRLCHNYVNDGDTSHATNPGLRHEPSSCNTPAVAQMCVSGFKQLKDEAEGLDPPATDLIKMLGQAVSYANKHLEV